MRITASQKYPEKYREIAGNGFNQAVKLYAYSLGVSFDEAFSMLCVRLGRVEEQMSGYLSKGLPDNLVDRVLEILKQHKVPFAKYQLKPTIAVVEMTLDHEKRSKS